MEEQGNEGDLLGHVIRPPSLRTGSLKATLSGRLTPRSSPSFRRSQSSRTPRKDVRVYASPFHWFRGRRLLPWLVMIGIWSYVGFHVQSKWAHSGGSERHTAFGSRIEIDQDLRNNVLHEDRHEGRSTLTSNSSERVNKEVTHVKMPRLGIVSPVNLKKWFWKGKQGPEKENIPNKPNNLSFGNENLVLNSSGSLTFLVDHYNTSKNVVESSLNQTVHENVPKKSTHSFNGSEDRDHAIMGGSNPMLRNVISETEDVDVTVKKNTSFGLLVGPFDKTENKVLGWNAGKRYGTCNRKGLFANTVRGRSFIVVLHELSMTGAPLAMMELASEILSCGGRVSAIALSRKGGLMQELLRRGIKLLKDKSVQSFRAAMKVDLVIAGSAVSALWIERYLLHHKRGSDRLIWWVMENRHEYFDRSKHILHKVKALVFLSEIQSQKWMTWCGEEGIKLPSILEVVPLSVNDELAFVAGLQTALNSPLFSVEKMLERRKALREEVRQSMGLDSNDMLVMTLSSINPGKGQLILLKAALTIVDGNFVPKINVDHIDSMEISRIVSGDENSIKESKGISRVLSDYPNITKGGKFHLHKAISSKMSLNQHRIQNGSSKTMQNSSHSEVLERGQPTRKILDGFERNSSQTLKLLIGSVGSKSNKVPYMKSMLGLIAHHPKLARLILWTPATIHVAPLYAAADAYVINSQGIGETFGRVTIEAMAFGLPILGTDAGGTKEIVEDNITGLLHPVGQNGIQILSQHLHFLLESQTVREEMGQKGREKVEKLFLKHHMYDKLGEILRKCMRYV